MSLRCGCKCGRCPDARDYFRLRNTNVAGVPGQNGKWVSGCCLEPESWGSVGPQRLFIANNDNQIYAAYVGNPLSQQEDEMLMLKMAVFVQK